MSQPLISLCMIVRDEQATLERSIASARPYVDEVVVLDTGSSDGTAALARTLGAEVLQAEWTHDFATARNRGLGAARGTFAFVIDGDEWIEAGPPPAALRAELEADVAGRIGVEVVDRLDGGATRQREQVRLFRRDAGTRYSGAFRERLAPAASPGSVRASGLVLGHDGYLTAERGGRGRAQRNAQTLERALDADQDDTASRFFLVWEQVPLHAGRAWPGAQRLGALEHLEQVTAREGALEPSWAVEAARLHAAVLLAAGRAPEARELLDRHGDRGVGCELLRADAELALAVGDPSAAERALERIGSCFDRRTRDRGAFAEPALAGAVARARAAEAYLHLGRSDEAREMVQEALTLPGGGAAPWNACAAVERACGRPAEATRAYLEGLRADPLDPWAWAGVGELLLAAGNHAQAVDPLVHAVQLAPGWDAAEEALATAMLLDGRGDDVLAVFGDGGRTAGAAAHAAIILASAATGRSVPVERVDPAAPGSVQRILSKLAAAGRPDLLHNLALGLRGLG